MHEGTLIRLDWNAFLGRCLPCVLHVHVVLCYGTLNSLGGIGSVGNENRL